MESIKDSVHDQIALGPAAAALLDTEPVQRLRHVKQLSTVRLVYPSANHTRFEHSLGVAHLAREATDRLDVPAGTARHVEAAALLHDVGHGPYGHQTEDAIRRHTGRHHDEIGHLLDGTQLGAVLREHDLDPDRVAALVRGEGPYGQLVAGELDVDRMDYLVRDAHHVGVPYGTIDHGRLLSALTHVGDRLALAEGNVETAESLLLARSLMNGTVYRHHVSRIAGAMLDRASERLLRGPADAEAFARMADHDLLYALREHCPAFARRIEYRDLYKRAVWAPIGEVPDDLPDLSYEECRTLEREIAADAGVDPAEVVVDVPSRPDLTESRVTVVVDGEPTPLGDVSEAVAAQRAAERRRWRLGVYAPADLTDAVGEAAQSRLGLTA